MKNKFDLNEIYSRRGRRLFWIDFAMYVFAAGIIAVAVCAYLINYY